MAATGASVAHWYATGRQGDRRAIVDATYEQVAVAGELLHEALPVRSGQEPAP